MASTKRKVIEEGLIDARPEQNEVLASRLSRALNPEQYETEENKREVYRATIESIQVYLLELLEENKFQEVLNFGQELLLSFGVEEARQVSSTTVGGAILLTEACNLAAKIINEIFYLVKPAMIVASWKCGASFGLGPDQCYYLSDLSVGAASFHDPNEEIPKIIFEILKEADVPIWEDMWSGIPRQDQAFEALKSYSVQSVMIDELSEQTLPALDLANKETWMQADKKGKWQVKFGEILKQK